MAKRKKISKLTVLGRVKKYGVSYNHPGRIHLDTLNPDINAPLHIRHVSYCNVVFTRDWESNKIPKGIKAPMCADCMEILIEINKGYIDRLEDELRIIYEALTI